MGYVLLYVLSMTVSFVCLLKFYSFSWLFIVLSIVTSLLIIDLLTGLIHIWLDNYSLPNLSVYLEDRNINSINDLEPEKLHNENAFGLIAFDFQLHHRQPQGITKKTLMMLLLPIIKYAQLPMAIFINLLIFLHCNGHFIFFLFVINLLILLTQPIHQWAHTNAKNIPSFVRLLQKQNLFLSKKNHLKHHEGFKENFCIFNGWMNPILNILYNFVEKYSHKK